MKRPGVVLIGLGISTISVSISAIGAADKALSQLGLYRRLRASGLDMVLGREEACDYVSRTTPEM